MNEPTTAAAETAGYRESVIAWYRSKTIEHRARPRRGNPPGRRAVRAAERARWIGVPVPASTRKTRRAPRLRRAATPVELRPGFVIRAVDYRELVRARVRYLDVLEAHHA